MDQESQTVIGKYNYHMNNCYQFCIALLPILCLMNVPLIDISLGTVFVVLSVPYAVLHIVYAKRNTIQRELSFGEYCPFVLFYLYLIIRSDGSLTRIILCLLTLIHLIGFFYGSIQANRIRKIIEWFALINSILVLLQTLSFYLFDIEIQYIPRMIIHEHFQNSYVFRDEPGLYRPSALFLEPSHFAQYCCFSIISMLFPADGKAKIKRALIVSMGCVLTTSGMGMALTALILVYFAFSHILYLKKNNKLRIQQVVRWSIVTIAACIAIIQIPFVRVALLRVFSSVDGYNAISGRLGLWKSNAAIGTMDLLSFMVGYGYHTDFPYYLTGLVDSVYKFGIIGVILEVFCFWNLMKKKKANYVWCVSISFLLLFCVAHLTSIFSQIFYFALIIPEVYLYERFNKENL